MIEHSLTDQPRINILMDLVRQLSVSQSPQEVLKTYARGLRDLSDGLCFISLSQRNLQPGEYKITRFCESLAEEQLVRQPNPWEQWEVLPTHRGGLLGQLIQTPTPKWLEEMAVSDDPVLGDRLAQMRTLLAIPLFDAGQAQNWAILVSSHSRAFDTSMVEDSILRSNLVGMAVRYVRALEELNQAHAKIQQEVKQIARIQQGLLPSQLPRIPGLTLAADLRTYDTAGGDLYDIYPLTQDPQGPWALLMADASGHGPAATTVSAMVYAILHTYPDLPQGPAELLQHANRHLCHKRIESSFVTATLGFFDPAKRTLTYARAGHPPALVKDPSAQGKVRRLDQVGEFPLGIDPDVIFTEVCHSLEPGQTILFYTDGITEAKNPQGRMFGVEGIERAMSHCMGDPHCTVQTLGKFIREHEAGVRPMDDQTLLAMQVGVNT